MGEVSNTIKSLKIILVHSPVLLQTVINNLDIRPGRLYIDATAGEGGHLKEILSKGGRVLAIDIDKSQIDALRVRFKKEISEGNLIVYEANFSNIKKIAELNNFFPVHGILLDLGLSYRQISSSGKGLSYKNLNENLDMRLDKKIKVNAADIVNSYTSDQLYEVFAKYSEDINSRSISEGIVRARYLKKLKKVGDLLKVIESAIKMKDTKTQAKIFQALRIKVNDEIENLKKALVQSSDLLINGGRLLVISFHSLEDRVVKKFEKSSELFYMSELFKGSRDLRFERSAKLRVLIKK